MSTATISSHIPWAGPERDAPPTPAASTAVDSGQTSPALTDREIEVLLTWLRVGTKESAGRELFIGTATVKSHLTRIRQKYMAVGRPAASKAALFIRAVQDGYIDISDWQDVGLIDPEAEDH
ncbi:DNA-binding CsgD family transcriptional regulator [Gordonia amarae]|uniref:Putative LuxR family transcriptional regulator n=1 Tax=Gordonia amarae NBRC 15530 TaxID=1075090 RepID=G7GWV2_9ACTN|nr:LuxR C-terminal-related transcriptional regulator [Gordonia amarae]MCS3880377.1 DNA-binding CsgD family transcriptional regulator [Gordonia amarae]GAB08077.1 putative LuxR family transcriptional regulator [Gordonia amarae NBRC 15530]